MPEGREQRALPEYGGVSRGSSGAARALWLPRVLLSPAYVASDMVARPVRLLARHAEKHHWRERIHDFFTFGPEQRFGLFPTGWVDTGFNPSVGVYFYWDGPPGASDVRVRATTGGADWWSVNALWGVPLGAGALSLVGSFQRRQDAAFHGLGGDSPEDVVRYGERGLEAHVAYARPLTRQLFLTSLLLEKWWVFDPSVDDANDDPSLAQAIRGGQLPAPPALYNGVVALGAGLRLDFDTRRGRVVRRPRFPADFAHVSGSGVAASAAVYQFTGLQRTRAEADDPGRLPAWLSYGAMLVGTLDLTGTQRRLELELYGAFADPLPGAGEVPFREQVHLGGGRPLQGFGSRRLIDRSAAVATLRYRWPVWSDLDGILHYAVGNVFGPHWGGIGFAEARASFGMGIATAATSDQVFQILLAFGTERFGEGGSIETTRLAAGTTVTF